VRGDYSHVTLDLQLMSKAVHISEAAKQLGVTAQHLRMLEWEGRIPPARRDFNGRIYSEFDIALLKSMGVGQRPQKLKRAEDVLGGVR
jgi:MerR HTH family regulatory protein